MLFLTLWMGATVAALFGSGYYFYNAVIHGASSFWIAESLLILAGTGIALLPFLADYIIECWRRK